MWVTAAALAFVAAGAGVGLGHGSRQAGTRLSAPISSGAQNAAGSSGGAHRQVKHSSARPNGLRGGTASIPTSITTSSFGRSMCGCGFAVMRSPTISAATV